MQAAHSWTRRNGTSTVVAAALAAVIALTLFGLVAEGFRSSGLPFQELTVAERACATHRYVSEREQCMRDYVDARRGQAVAGDPPAP